MKCSTNNLMTIIPPPVNTSRPWSTGILSSVPSLVNLDDVLVQLCVVGLPEISYISDSATSRGTCIHTQTQAVTPLVRELGGSAHIITKQIKTPFPTSFGLSSSLSSSLSAASWESLDSGPLSPTCRSDPGMGVIVAACRHRNCTASGRTAGRIIALWFIFEKVT